MKTEIDARELSIIRIILGINESIANTLSVIEAYYTVLPQSYINSALFMYTLTNICK